jgi:hypothetical protein
MPKNIAVATSPSSLPVAPNGAGPVVVDDREDLETGRELDAGLASTRVHERQVLVAGELRGLAHLDHRDVQELDERPVLRAGNGENVGDRGGDAEALAEAPVREGARDGVGIRVTPEQDDVRLVLRGREDALELVNPLRLGDGVNGGEMGCVQGDRVWLSSTERGQRSTRFGLPRPHGLLTSNDPSGITRLGRVLKGNRTPD